MAEATESRPEAGRELDRIVFFSDAVFAIAITILVLDIRVPDGLSPAELPAEVVSLWPKYLSYVISFLVLAIYWQAHHRVFKPIRGYDGTLVWLNFLFLMAVAFLPFPTSLLGEYGGQRVSVAVYAANAAVASLLLSAISWYAIREHRLVAEAFDEEEAQAAAGPGGAGGVPRLYRCLLLQPDGGHVLLAAPRHYRSHHPKGMVSSRECVALCGDSSRRGRPRPTASMLRSRSLPQGCVCPCHRPVD